MTPEQPRPDAGANPDPTSAVADALAGLDGLESRPTAQHVAAFERVHGALTDALSAIDGV
jgi:hypothetical protein